MQIFQFFNSFECTFSCEIKERHHLSSPYSPPKNTFYNISYFLRFQYVYESNQMLLLMFQAHRVVLVAACPMLQSMENAAVGSHLEVRLAADIKQESIQTFLQYLYEGFMMLTEQNCRDVEKIARLLQVDSVIKCCADFNKCLGTKTGQMSANDQYKYTFHDMIEFKHVRSSEMQKTVQEKTVKRTADYPRPPSPGSKRQRTQDMHADDTTSMASSYGHMAPDPWDRVPKLGMPFHTRVGQSSQQAGVVDMLEDSLELIETDPPDSSGGRAGKDQRSSQKGVSIAVASQVNSSTDLQVVDVATEQARSEARSRTNLPSQTRTAPANQTNSVSENGKSTNSHPAAKPPTHPSTPVMNEKLQVNSPPVMSPSSSQFNNRSSPQVRPESSAQKPFAAGSESQSSQPPPQQGSEIASNTNTAETVSETGCVLLAPFSSSHIFWSMFFLQYHISKDKATSFYTSKPLLVHIMVSQKKMKDHIVFSKLMEHNV